MANPVWVVDDNPAVAKAQTVLLTVEGIPARSLVGTTAVLDALEESQPALMILDLSMPDGGGNAVLQAVMARPGWTFPIIVSTGYEDGIQKELRGRVYKLLPKTIDPETLVDHVRRALEHLGQLSP